MNVSIQKSVHLQDVLTALTEVINSQSGNENSREPSANEYFALIIKVVGAGGQLSQNLMEILIILEGIISKVSKDLVQAQFKYLSTILAKILQANDEDAYLCKIIKILGLMLQMQDFSDGFWSSLQPLQIINMLLGLMDDGRASVRKAVHQNLLGVLLVHQQRKARPLFSYLQDFSVGLLRTATRSDYKRSLYLLFFLESTLALFPGDMLGAICVAILRLQLCNQPVLTAAAYRTVDATVQSPYLQISSPQLYYVLHTLVNTRINTKDMQATTFYCTGIGNGIVKLHNLNVHQSRSLLVPAFNLLVDVCESEFTQAHLAACTAIKRIITVCIDKNFVAEACAHTDSKVHEHALVESLSAVYQLLQLKYQHAWLYSLDTIRCLFDKITGSDAAKLLQAFTVTIGNIYQGIELGTLQIDTEKSLTISATLGTALKSLGVENFVASIPFSLPETPVHFGIDVSREWLISILQNNLKTFNCRLVDFQNSILPVARLCNKAVQNAIEYQLTKAELKSIRSKVVQFWSLFPSFCFSGPVDVKESFPALLHSLMLALQSTEYPEIHHHVIIGLTHLCQRAIEKSAPHVQGSDSWIYRKHAHVIIPVLLKALESLPVTDNDYPSLLHCLSAWSAVAPVELIAACGRNLLKLLLTQAQNFTPNSRPSRSVARDSMDVTDEVNDESGSNHVNDVAAGWVSVMQAIIPHLPDPMIGIVYKTIRPLLSLTQSISVQKRAYQVLSSLLKHRGDILNTHEPRISILHTITESLLTCHVSARNMRLRCLESLLETLTVDELLETSPRFIGEVLLCLKDFNKKSRDSSLTLLKLMIDRLPTQHMLTSLCAAVVGETVTMRVAGITGLCFLLLQNRKDNELLEQVVPLLDIVCILLREECVEETRAILSFIRVCANVLTTEMLLPILPQFVLTFTTGLGVQKQKFASRIRAIMRKLIQKVGDEKMRSAVPELDMPLLEYILKKARRAFKRKHQKLAYEKTLLDKMLGSDSEDSDDDNETAADRLPGKGKRPRDGTEVDRDEATIFDHRLQRPKASRPQDFRSTLPTSLEDLVDGSGDATRSRSHPQSEVYQANRHQNQNGRRNRAPSSNNNVLPAEEVTVESEPYEVTVTSLGKVVIKELNTAVNASRLTHDAKIEEDRSSIANNRKQDHALANEKGNGQLSKDAAKKPRLKEPGAEYRTSKAGGDVWRRGMLQPHAYIPLDPRLLNKKNHKEAVNTFAAVVNSNNRSKQQQKKKARLSGGTKSNTSLNKKQRESMRNHQIF